MEGGREGAAARPMERRDRGRDGRTRGSGLALRAALEEDGEQGGGRRDSDGGAGRKGEGREGGSAMAEAVRRSGASHPLEVRGLPNTSAAAVHNPNTHTRSNA